MKRSKFLVVLLLLAMTSCLDTEETILLNADNSGVYTVKFDLSRMLELAASMNPDAGKEDRVMQKKDTIVYLRDLVDTASSLTADEKRLYKDGMLQVKLDEGKNQMSLTMSTPFKNPADLTIIKNHLPEIISKLKGFEKAAGDLEKPGENEDMKMDDKSANPLGEYFTFSATAGRISNTITDVEAFKKLVTADSTFSMMTQMAGMMGDFNYHTIITVPKAAKKFQGPGSSASADKKTISFSTTLAEILEHPEKVSYSVEY